MLSTSSLAPCAQMMLSSIYSAAVLAQASDATIKEQPMALDAHPGFLVATIKPSDPEAHTGWAFPTDGHHVACVDANLATILTVAYGIHEKQIAGAPEWFTKEHFDINGVPDVPGIPSFPQQKEMYQKLLADRFHLVFHRETRDLPIYAITIAKGGPILKPAAPNETMNAGNSGSPGVRIQKFRSMSMPDFALNMNFHEDRPVVDETGLSGRYDFTLKWTYDIAMENEPGAPPSLFTAIKEQLGLRMDAVKGPAEVFVIDHVERPSAN